MREIGYFCTKASMAPNWVLSFSTACPISSSLLFMALSSIEEATSLTSSQSQISRRAFDGVGTAAHCIGVPGGDAVQQLLIVSPPGLDEQIDQFAILLFIQAQLLSKRLKVHGLSSRTHIW